MESYFTNLDLPGFTWIYHGGFPSQNATFGWLNGRLSFGARKIFPEILDFQTNHFLDLRLGVDAWKIRDPKINSSTSLPNTLWGSMLEPPNTSWEKGFLGAPNTSSEGIWRILED